jgi:hypothetical protein
MHLNIINHFIQLTLNRNQSYKINFYRRKTKHKQKRDKLIKVSIELTEPRLQSWTL